MVSGRPSTRWVRVHDRVWRGGDAAKGGAAAWRGSGACSLHRAALAARPWRADQAADRAGGAGGLAADEP
jgi:hypothetical protein